MNEIITTASVMSDEQVVAHLEEMSPDLVGETEIGLYEAALARIAERQKQEVAAETARKAAEVARAEAVQRAKDAFEQMRHGAAADIAEKAKEAGWRKDEEEMKFLFTIAAALRGEGHPNWGKAVLKAFLDRFPEGKRGRYHDVVVATIAEAEAAIAREAEEEAEAERIRAEAKRRYERNRADRAERNRRSRGK